MKFIIILEKSGVSLTADEETLLEQLKGLEEAKQKWIVVKG